MNNFFPLILFLLNYMQCCHIIETVFFFYVYVLFLLNVFDY